ncbi:hypothetical protein COCNU_06G018640 [Cocos nucifera]|uniref:Uncharacterized protein n=1 Tax=Cocos nucifera TaxID=13894 RepID=A0A8K0IDR9_COCNU|nr:hypothetical protein COCNU_06G018640 [Cocos nucifera]
MARYMASFFAGSRHHHRRIRSPSSDSCSPGFHCARASSPLDPTPPRCLQPPDPQPPHYRCFFFHSGQLSLHAHLLAAFHQPPSPVGRLSRMRTLLSCTTTGINTATYDVLAREEDHLPRPPDRP